MYLGRPCSARSTSKNNAWTLVELKTEAKRLGMRGYSRMNKSDLCRALNELLARLGAEVKDEEEKKPRRSVRKCSKSRRLRRSRPSQPSQPSRPSRSPVRTSGREAEPFFMDTNVAVEFMLKVDYNDIFNMCQANRVFRRVCMNNDFWRRRYRQDYGQVPADSPIKDWKEAYRIRHQGKLYMFGSGMSGTLGTGDDNDRLVPTEINTFSRAGVVQVSCGNSHTGVVTLDGKLYMFGVNYDGQFGIGENEYRNYLPRHVDSLTGVVQVSCGAAHTGAVTRDGKLYMFGNNKSGQLGIGAKKDIDTLWWPKEVLTDIVQVSCGDYYTAAVTSDGILYVFGYNYDGQLGLDTEEGAIRTPTAIRRVRNVLQVSCADEHMAVVTKDGKLYTTGSNPTGELGLGDRNGRGELEEVELPLAHGVVQVSCGLRHTAALTRNGRLYMFGNNRDGQLGIVGVDGYIIPVELPLAYDVVQVSCGNFHTGVIDMEGNVHIFGRNHHGQLGGDVLISDATMISCGYDYTGVIARSSPEARPSPPPPVRRSPPPVRRSPPPVRRSPRASPDHV